MSDSALPHEDQLVTLVSVRDGDIYVTSANVLVQGERSLALDLDTSLADPPAFARDQGITLLYARGDRIMRLKTAVSETVTPSRITVHPIDEAKEGDRRDYRRADVKARVSWLACEGDDVGAERARQADRTVELEEYEEQNVNLSGSGIQITSPVAYEPGTLLDLRVVLPLPGAKPIVVLGEIVRPIPEPEGGFRLAIRFAEIAEIDQDRVVYTVFSSYFQSHGLAEDLVLEV